MSTHSTYYLFRTLRLIWQSSHLWAILNAVLVVIRGLIPLAQLWAVKVIIDTTSKQVASGVFNINEVIYGLLLMASLFVLNSITSSLHSIVKERHSFYLNDVVASIIHHKTTNVEYGFFEDANFHNVFYRAVLDSSTKPQGVFYNLISLLQQSLTIGSLAIVLITIHWSLPIIILILGLPIVVVRIIFSRRYYTLLKEQTIDERKVQYYNRVLTAKEFAKEVRIFRLAEHFQKLYRTTLRAVREKRVKLMVSDSIREAVVQLFASLIFVAVFGFVTWQAVVIGLSAGSLAMYLMALQRSYGVAQELLAHIAALYDSNLFLKNFFNYIDMDEACKNTASDNNVTKGEITFDNVSFSYPNSSRQVLSHVSFKINKGETVAIVGRNGCGKSTIIKLICGLYHQTEGEIKVGGKISAIFQDFMLYNTSARDNIRFGDIDKTDNTKDYIKQAAQNAGLDNLLSNLRNGYETQLGTLTPESEMLSQGEWQRVALARSFYAESDIIVMDEPTSSLDAFTEASLTENFKAITLGRTAIIVSHRLSSIKMADKVLVIDNHQLKEMGTYNELLAQKGLFYEMISNLE